ncbi:MAG: methyltransferase domain-containing protein [Bacteroidetes bacterium]|nr:MAG: methyltransferase domain-containing protein [Bacteroidota bacterium]
METSVATLDAVRAYYGQVLQSTRDLKTSACCPAEALPPYLKAALRNIEADILDRFYGCGAPIPPALEGATVLDLGCGSGRDVYLASQLVGPEGFVIGVDMTEEQLAVARRHMATHMDRFGYSRPNVSFRHGFVEDLRTAGIEDASVDVVISNCVLNLSPDKPAAFAEIFRVLKPGGEVYISDVFADRRIPAALAADPVLYGECLAGALYVEDFRRLLLHLGVPDYRVVSSTSIAIDDPEIERRIGAIRFFSRTIRAFKLPGLLEDRCEDYGQVARYLGTMTEARHRFVLDDHHIFETGRPVLVCGNTAAMLSQTRYRTHFQVVGDRSVHYGLFDCTPVASAANPTGGCGC